MNNKIYKPSLLLIIVGLAFFLVPMFICAIFVYHPNVWQVFILKGIFLFGLVGMAISATSRILLDKNYFYYKGQHPAKPFYIPSFKTLRVPLKDVYMVRLNFDEMLIDTTITFACIINGTFVIYSFTIGQFLFGPNGQKCKRFAEELIAACEVNDIDLTIVGGGKEFRRETSKENYERLTKHIINEYGRDDDDSENESPEMEDEMLEMKETPQISSDELNLLFVNVKVQYIAISLLGVFLYYCAYLALNKFGLFV